MKRHFVKAQSKTCQAESKSQRAENDFIHEASQQQLSSIQKHRTAAN